MPRRPRVNAVAMHMTDYEQFKMGYWRTLSTKIDGVEFIDGFYKRFLSSSSEVAELFADTDFSLQKNMLTLSLVHVASFDPAKGPDSIMRHLAARHRELNVKPHHYKLWFDSLLETIKEFDPEYDEDIGESWIRRLTPGVNYMISECS
jgi:hemoglobin-like flavoprotein